jgi:hypothetical protein
MKSVDYKIIYYVMEYSFSTLRKTQLYSISCEVEDI